MSLPGTLPGVTSILTDGGLQFARQVDLGDSVVILGTAEQGPLNQPVAAASPTLSKRIFGSYGSGTLVRGLLEAFGASSVGKDLRGCRIGAATKATLGLAEATNSTAAYTDNPTYEDTGVAIQDAFVLSAKKEGEVMNTTSIRLDTVNGQLVVVIYNPATELESYFTYDSDPNVNAEVHDVQELVDAINADSNLNQDLEASMKALDVQFEVDLSGASDAFATGVSITGDILRVTLRDRLDTANVGGSPLPTGVHDVETLYADYNANMPTVGGRILEVTSVYQKDIEIDELVAAKGYATVTLASTPYKETGDMYLGWLNGSTWTWSTAKAKQVFTLAYIGSVEDATVKAYAWVGAGAVDTDTFHLYKSQSGVVSEIAAADFTLTATAGAQMIEFDSVAEVPDPGSLLLVSYTSEYVALTEVATRSACLATGSWLNYFVSGNTVTFGGSVPADLYLTYKFKREFAIGGQVVLEDPRTGKFMFPATDVSPKEDVEDATLAAPVTFGFTYSYQPEWINVTTSAVSLKGGSDGIVMSKSQHFDALADAYDNLQNYEASIFVPMNAYLDDIKTSYNVETGDLETMNAGFHSQLHDFLVSLSENVIEAQGVISVKPASGADLASVRSWAEKLTVVSSGDPLRGANIMRTFDSKFIDVIAAEPIMSNTEVTLPYSATAEAIYAGLLAGLKPGSAPTNKRVDNVVGLRYNLSRGQLTDLTDFRYITMRRGGSFIPGFVITDGVTAAAFGSDFVRVSTRRAVFAAMRVVRQVAAPFIGEPADAEGRMALDTAIKRGLQGMVESRDLRDFSFNITSTLQQQVLGIVDVELILVPQFEMRNIRVTVKVRPSL